MFCLAVKWGSGITSNMNMVATKVTNTGSGSDKLLEVRDQMGDTVIFYDRLFWRSEIKGHRVKLKFYNRLCVHDFTQFLNTEWMDIDQLIQKVHTPYEGLFTRGKGNDSNNKFWSLSLDLYHQRLITRAKLEIAAMNGDMRSRQMRSFIPWKHFSSMRYTYSLYNILGPSIWDPRSRSQGYLCKMPVYI